MFSWICPKCGREVPPAYSDCPTCAMEAKTPEASISAPGVAVPPPLSPPPHHPSPTGAPTPSYAPPPAQYSQQQYPPPQYPQQQYPQQQYPPQPQAFPPAQTYPPPNYAAPPVFNAPAQHAPRSGALAQVLAVLLTIAVVGLVFFGLQYFRNRGRAIEDSAAATKMEQPSTRSASGHPLAKFLEVTGVRLTEEKGKRFCRVLVVNHSQADLPDLQLTILVKAANREIVEFPVTLSSLGPYESRDVVAEVRLSLKPYEMPDWKMTNASFEITSQP